MADFRAMICEGCGGPVDSPFCPRCSRRMQPTDGLPAEPDLQFRVVYRRHMSAARLRLLRFSAMVLLLGGLILVIAALQGR